MAESVLRKAANLLRDLAAAPLGLGYAARQCASANCFVGHKHNPKGNPDRMYEGCL